MSDPSKAWLECSECEGSGYGGNAGHVYNSDAEMDGIAEHQCVQCPVACPKCGGHGGREVLLVPTKPDYARMAKRFNTLWKRPEYGGTAGGLVLTLRATVDDAVGTTWTIKETE